MGLLIQFPVDLKESDRVKLLSDGGICLKSYGPPFLFWFYSITIIAIIYILYLAIRIPIEKLLILESNILSLSLSYSLYLLLICTPTTIVCYLFYEKNIIKNKNNLFIVHKVFWKTVSKKRFNLKLDGLFIKHFFDSPNIAAIENKEDMEAFKNRGYYQLFAITVDNKKILIDRHSQPRELKKMMSLLNKY